MSRNSHMIKLYECLFPAAFLVACAQVATANAAEIRPPSHTSKVCDVRSYGAVGDGITKDTKSIQAAIDNCAGGIVLLQKGTFLSGMIRLTSNETLQIDRSATLLGSQDPSDYPDTNPPTTNSQLQNCRKALVYAENARHLTITGGGKIDGNGNKPEWTVSKVPERTRPMAVYIALSNDVTIEGITISHSAMWTLVNLETDNLVVRNVNIYSPNGPTRDGIDIVDCHHVLVEGVNVYSEDDAICVKSGVARGVEDLTVRDSHILQSSVAQGLKLGTASTGHFTDLTFENITINRVDKAAMAVESVDGAVINNVRFNNITFAEAGSAFFVILGKRGAAQNVGSIDSVTFSNIQGKQTKHTWGSPLSGTRINGQVYAVSNLVFNHVHIVSAGGLSKVPRMPPEYDGRYPDPNLWGNLPASGLFIRHVNGIVLRDTSFTTSSNDARQTFVKVDASAKERLPANTR